MTDIAANPQAHIINVAARPTSGIARYSLDELGQLVEAALMDMGEDNEVVYTSYSRASTVAFARQALDNIRTELGHRASVARRAARDADELEQYAGKRLGDHLALKYATNA